MTTRRELLTGAAVLLIGAFPAGAQTAAKVYRIGFVNPVSAGPQVVAFREGLRELGYVEGKNMTLEARFAEGRAEALPALVAEVLRLNVDVLVAGSTLGALAAKAATKTVPVVFAGLIDPVAPGIVSSLARPGGNITGTTFAVSGAGFAGKWLEFLKEAVPGIAHVAVLWHSTNPASALVLRELRTAGRTLNVRIDAHDAGNAAMLDASFAAISASRAQGLIVTNDPFYFANRAKLARFAAASRLPAVYFAKQFADDGGLLTYGGSLEESYRRAAGYVDRILKGAKPADLPVEQPTRFELVVNLKAAKALGLTIPQSILLRADRVID